MFSHSYLIVKIISKVFPRGEGKAHRLVALVFVPLTALSTKGPKVIPGLEKDLDGPSLEKQQVRTNLSMNGVMAASRLIEKSVVK